MKIKNVVFESRSGATLSFHTQTRAALREPSGKLSVEEFDGIHAASRRVAAMLYAEDSGTVKQSITERISQVHATLSLLPVAASIVEPKATPKAQTEPPYIVKLSPLPTSRWVSQWDVPSTKRANTNYTVSQARNGEFQCSCPAWTRARHVCKHISMVIARSPELQHLAQRDAKTSQK